MKNLFHKRNFFRLVLPHIDFILYMKICHIIHYFRILLQKEFFLYFKVWSSDNEIHLTRTLIFSINEKRIYSSMSSCRSAINSPSYKNCNKCGRNYQNPSAKNGLVHFLLGAMLPCSTPFSTSAYNPPSWSLR